MSREDVQKMQDDLDVLSDWSKKWLLQFNVAKCKVMHRGAQNLKGLTQLSIRFELR